MNHSKKVFVMLTLVTAVALFIAGGCKKDNAPAPAQTTNYKLMVKDVLGVSGTVTFTESTGTSTIIDIVLVNASSGNHPANLYMNSAAENGAVKFELNPVDASGKSSTVVSMNYSTLIAYDGCIKVINSSDEPDVILAQGDIGGNVITDTNISYPLSLVGSFGVSGTALFEKRVNGKALVTVTLTGIIGGQTYPVALCSGAAVEGGETIVTLNPVDGTWKSSTSINSIIYDSLIVYNGYIKVMRSISEPNIIIARGDIGGNLLTGTKKTYTLSALSPSTISGTALFEQRINGNTLVTISLSGTIPGQSYSATINLGSVESVGGGPIVKLLSNVDGTTGKSYTNIQKLDGGTNITYENWLVYDGYLNVYQGLPAAADIICQGNIGSN